MTSIDIYKKYESLFHDLKLIIKLSERRVIGENTDTLFSHNVNFFVKSYLINICSYLEALLQDLATMRAIEINSRLIQASIPHNYLLWRLTDNIKDKELAYKVSDLHISKKEISDNLSANPYKTIKLFQKLGVDLGSNQDFLKNKDLVSTIVNKRNSIIHHNDRAADISFSDLTIYIDTITSYSKGIAKSLL
ncbi:HEPN domain-containing protein [Aeromonas salmonicida]|uniref:HEPN domain-containing protein n=2 Tax=Aeromonas salmonicida TaxID=645 RepID=UPI0038BC99A4